MTSIIQSLPADFWQTLTVSKPDIEFLHNHLFESETPLTAYELAVVLIRQRISGARASSAEQKKGIGRVYLPKEQFKAGDALVLPALGWRKAVVLSTRAGANPESGPFDVIEVELEGGVRKLFAAALENHKLNDAPVEEPRDDLEFEPIASAHGAEIARKIETSFSADKDLVRIAGRWFPRALLVDVNLGHLNLAEAVLEVAAGHPVPTPALMEQIELPAGVNSNLVEFSLNYALQEDPRFDEVGPAGQVLWCLRRLEPEEVRNTPGHLQYREVEYDRAVLTPAMLRLESEIDDELSPVDQAPTAGDEVVVSLSYPHWRAGTLPVSARVNSFFPTAYESPRVYFSLIDGKTGERMPAWVVREHGYVYGLREWFKKNELIPGGLVTIRRGQRAGEVVIEARTHRPTREWIRTALSGSDGGLVFAVLKQNVACDYNERMVTFVPDVAAVEQAFAAVPEHRQSFEALITDMIRELSKLTPQGHVHAQELYSAINILRRCPPGPLFAVLATHEAFTHVGDLYFRLGQLQQENKQ